MWIYIARLRRAPNAPVSLVLRQEVSLQSRLEGIRTQRRVAKWCAVADLLYSHVFRGRPGPQRQLGLGCLLDHIAIASFNLRCAGVRSSSGTTYVNHVA